MNRFEIILNILIKKEEDYYSAHCLDFDLVATDDTMDGAQKAIIENCISHIIFSIQNDNMEYLMSHAPQEVWHELIALNRTPGQCKIERKILELPTIEEDLLKTIPPFVIQETLCDELSSTVS